MLYINGAVCMHIQKVLCQQVCRKMNEIWKFWWINSVEYTSYTTCEWFLFNLDCLKSFIDRSFTLRTNCSQRYLQRSRCPQVATACNGVHSSISRAFISAFDSTSKRTISGELSIQLWNIYNQIWMYWM